MTSPEAIESAFAELAETVDGLAEAYDHEPEQFFGDPALTMLYLRYDTPEPDRRPIGHTIEVTWHWRVTLYIALKNGFWKEAQNQCRDLTFRLLQLPVAETNRTLGDVCEQWELVDAGAEPDLGEIKPGYLIKELRLTAWTWEAQA